jgi:hypothetical protein
MSKNKIIRNIPWQSLLLPTVLMITGAVLMGANSLGAISLDRLTNFWPMAIILVGLVELIPSEDTQQKAGND